MLETLGLRRAFGDLVAVDGVSFTLRRGEILGLLGPNGAGKTTTVSLVAGLLEPDGGEVRVDGAPLRGDADPRKRSVGLVTQEIALYESLSALQNLRFFGSLYGMSGDELDGASRKVLALVGLGDRAGDRVKDYSGGMKRRLNLAAGLLHDPEVLLLDEPTVGVDPQSRNAIFENIEALKAGGKAILYTTHYMEEAERLCDRVVIIDHGKVIADDAPRALSRSLPAPNRLIVELEDAQGFSCIEELASLPRVASAVLEDGLLKVKLKSLEEGAPEVLSWLSSKAVRYTQVSSERADLEEVFLALTGRSLRDS